MPRYRLNDNGVNQPMFNLSAEGTVARIGNFRRVRVHIGYASEFGAKGWIWGRTRERLAEVLRRGLRGRATRAADAESP
jgi:hypothetical protein